MSGCRSESRHACKAIRLSPSPGSDLLSAKIAVFLVAQNGKAQLGKMDPDLMRPPSLELSL